MVEGFCRFTENFCNIDVTKNVQIVEEKGEVILQQDYNIWFGRRLKEIMDERGITAKALEEMSDVGRMTIARIIKGRYATAEEVQAFAEAFGVCVERLKQKDLDLESIEERMDKYVEAAEVIEQLQNLLPKTLGKTESGQVWAFLGRAYYCLAEHQKATSAWKQSFNLLCDHSDLRLRAMGYFNLMIG